MRALCSETMTFQNTRTDASLKLIEREFPAR